MASTEGRHKDWPETLPPISRVAIPSFANGERELLGQVDRSESPGRRASCNAATAAALESYPTDPSPEQDRYDE